MGAASRRAASALLRLGAAGLGALPTRAAYTVADAGSLGVLAWSAAHERRVAPRGRGVARNQRIVYRDAMHPGDARRLTRCWARHMARLAADFASLASLPAPALADRVDWTGLARLRTVLAEGRGLIAVSGHIGVWELLAHVPALTGIPLAVVGRPTGSPALDLWLDGLRRRGGARVLPQRGALWPLVRALRRRQAIGLLADEGSRGRAVFAPFLGTQAATNPVAASLQRRTGAPIAVVSCPRTGPGRYRFEVWDLIRHRGDVPTEAVCSAVNDALSRAILAHPEQWLWGSRRFVARPAGERAGPDGLPPRSPRGEPSPASGTAPNPLARSR